MRFGLTLILILNVALSFNLFLFNLSLDGIADEMQGSATINFDDSNIRSFDSSGNYTLDGSVASAIQNLPTESGGSVDENNNFFTDPIKSFKNWFLDSTGIRYVLNFLNVVPDAMGIIFGNEFKAIGFAVGWLWHILSVFAVITWFKGN